MYTRLLCAVIFISAAICNAQDSIDVNYEPAPGKVLIHYTINADADQEYDVRVTVKRRSDASFQLVPADLTGDIGEGKFAGSSKTIIWKLNYRETQLLTGDDFYFDVSADRIESSGIPWYYYVGGTLAAGGAAAVLLLGKKESSTEPGTNGTRLTPPARP